MDKKRVILDGTEEEMQKDLVEFLDWENEDDFKNEEIPNKPKENEKITFDDNTKKFVEGYEHLLDKEKTKNNPKDT